MSLLQIVCDNCGAKYRLPETFTGSSAKCKQCGSSIHVAAQRAAAAAPAAAPAAAKPARAGTSAARPASAKPAAARPASSSAGRASARKPRPEADDAPAKSNKPLIFGGIGAAAAIVVVAVLMMGGDKKDPKKDKVAAKPAAEASAKPMEAAAKPAEKPVAAEAKAPKKKPVDEGPASPSAPAPEPVKPAAAPAKAAAQPAKAAPAAPAAPAPAAESPQGQGQGQGKPAAKPTETPAAKPAAGGGKSPKDALAEEREKLVLKDLDAWQKQNVKSLDQVPDVTKTTKALVYPAEITAEDQKKMADLLAEAKDGGGGARTGRALRKIEAMGFAGLYFLINTLREINYKDYDSLVWANQLNMSLTAITLGVNVGFVPVESGPELGKLDPRIAKWNADSVQQWLNGAQTQWPSKAKFDEYITKRKAKKDAEVEEGDKEGGGK